MFDSVPRTDRRRGNAKAGPIDKQPPQRRGARLASFAGGLALVALFAAPGHSPNLPGPTAAVDRLAEGALFGYRTAEARRLGHDVEALARSVVSASYAAADTTAQPQRSFRRTSFPRIATKRVSSDFRGFEARFANWPTSAEKEPEVQNAARDAAMAGDEILCLAQNIYFEARGETQVGKLAVGQVVMNRVASTKFPDSICGVVRQGGEHTRYKCQFSWWCDGKSDKPKDLTAWRESLLLAEDIFHGRTEDPTDGALWYHADYVAPYWRSAFIEGPTIGRHIFYLAQPKGIRTQLAKSSRGS